MSRLKFKSRDIPGHPGPGEVTTHQTRRAAWIGEGRERGRGTSVWLLIFLSEMVRQCLGMGWGHTLGSAALAVVTGDLIGC